MREIVMPTFPPKFFSELNPVHDPLYKTNKFVIRKLHSMTSTALVICNCEGRPPNNFQLAIHIHVHINFIKCVYVYVLDHTQSPLLQRRT